jgi:hypothetical protein
MSLYLQRGDGMDALVFNYKPFFAIIGDIIDSKKIQDRQQVQHDMTNVLNIINEKYKTNVSSKFMITLGDEFQGLLINGEFITEIIDTIEREMYPISLRFGIGVGSISTKINYDMPLGADGPAYYNARKMIEYIKKSKNKKMEGKSNIRIEVENGLYLSELINSIFSMSTVIKSRWTSRQREIIDAYIKCNEVQSPTAALLRINQSNVQKALKISGFYEYQRANKSITKVLSAFKENDDV